MRIVPIYIGKFIFSGLRNLDFRIFVLNDLTHVVSMYHCPSNLLFHGEIKNIIFQIVHQITLKVACVTNYKYNHLIYKILSELKFIQIIMGIKF